MVEQGVRLLRLYREILRAHRSKLQPGLRRLGDDYVRYEFRQHRGAKPEFLVGFEEQWTMYLQTLDGHVSGREMPAPSSSIEQECNDEQRAQLRKMEEQIRSLGTRE